jgi:hypothetical protein
VRRAAVVFWGSAVGVAVALAALAAVLLPYEALRLYTAAERERAWLITVWTAGVLAVLFGLTGLLGWRTGVGFRDIREAGSVRAAIERQREAMRARQEEPFHSRFDWWLISTGALLIGIYFLGWLALGR